VHGKLAEHSDYIARNFITTHLVLVSPNEIADREKLAVIDESKRLVSTVTYIGSTVLIFEQNAGGLR
jgi:hypothetical protein